MGQRESQQLVVELHTQRSEQGPTIRAGPAGHVPPSARRGSGRADDLAAAVRPARGQAMCGGFVARQARFAQATSVGAAAFHCARRERVFDRDIRRFGTATVDLLAVVREGHSAGRRSRRAAHRGSSVSCPWSGPRSARFSPHSGHRPGQSSAQRGQRQLEDDGVAHGLLQVDAVVDDPRQLVLVRGLVRHAVRVGEQLADARR